ncbi:sensor histidine kinase [Cecembia rubra]|uniref:sensor histidine kinase n=1 Tax=Cecembia rubra TaxID=1485585 RepID=UPI0027145BC8|nr:HAMP domain-containing sensor histidine kinase [Cecembia rubra]
MKTLIEDYFTVADIPQIEVNLPTDDKIIETDASLLSHAVKNIIENAIKYSPDSTEKPILDLIFEKNKFEIIVKDFGLGIPKEEQKHIFNSFFRAKNVSNIKGTGLGLNIVHEFVKKLGGKVSFSSKEGVGTTFIISMPYQEEK